MSVTSASTEALAAYHEAGHAVAAYLLGSKPRPISIATLGDDLGLGEGPPPLRGMKLDSDGSDRARLRLERAIIISLAGPIAQRTYRPGLWRDWHGEEDMATAATLAMKAIGSSETTSAFVNWLTLRAKELVSANWSLVEAVAERLTEDRSLSGDQIVATIEDRPQARRRRAG